jgi:hypothetical protein
MSSPDGFLLDFHQREASTFGFILWQAFVLAEPSARLLPRLMLGFVKTL